MTRTDASAELDVIRTAVTVVLEIPDSRVTAATRWSDDLGADSLAMIEIVEVAEDLLRRRGRVVRVDDDTLADLVTVADLAAALDHGGVSGGPTGIPV